MNVYRVTSISHGVHANDRPHHQGYILSFVKALTADDAVELVTNKIYHDFADNPAVMNIRFEHSCNIVSKLHNSHEPEVVLMDVVLK